MQKIWNKIENWLKSHNSAIFNNLSSGATEEKIMRIEDEMNIQFPEDFKQSYLIHNGQESETTPLIEEWELLSLEYILDEWHIMKNLYDQGRFLDATSKPIGEVKSDWWNPKWIPIASNGAGDLVCLDLDPAVGGNIGQIISFWHMDEQREKLADNFKSWLQQFANDLENGKYKVKKSGELIKIKS